jgi:hypothetical protein
VATLHRGSLARTTATPNVSEGGAQCRRVKHHRRRGIHDCHEAALGRHDDGVLEPKRRLWGAVVYAAPLPIRS